MKLSYLLGMASALVVGAVSSAHAQCPANYEAMGERQFAQNGATYTVSLCWNPKATPSGTGGSLRVTAYQGEKPVAETMVPVDVEGMVVEIKFDGAGYPLSATAPTFPVIVKARARGATFDQYTTDLWLFSLQASGLSKVFGENVSWESWGTQCEPECIDTTNTKTLVIIAPEKSAQGMHDLKLRQRGKTIPYGKSDKAAQAIDQTTRYVFTGSQYEAAP